eukprot:754983-Ditylum_brightwellii.AAC.1
MQEYIDRLDRIIRTHFSYKDHDKITDGNSITRKFCKKEIKNAGVALKAFTQFLSHSPATGQKYTEVENCWKRKPKLDYMALDEMKKSKDDRPKPKEQVAKKKAQKQFRENEKEKWADMDLSLEKSNEEVDNEEDANYDTFQPESHDDGAVIIQELAQCLDAAEKKIESHHQQPMEKDGNKHLDLLQTILERTAKLEEQRTSSTPKEVIQMMENTMLMEKKQKEYEDWQKQMLEQIDEWFQA